MTRWLLALTLLVLSPMPAFAADDRPGYGVVETMTPLQRKPEPSASGGSSAPARRDAATWLVRVRMDDGTYQVREVKKRRNIAVGTRVLLTNAGDVVPD
jgi:hypothetical protein